MIKKILIANRGEIAVRVIRTCKIMGIKTVAVYSKADETAMHTKLADEAICIGKNYSNESYLNQENIINSALITGADAIHPGYGFLSENSTFAEQLDANDIEFIGPSYKHIEIMGDKISAKRKAVEVGIPVVPGSAGEVKTAKDALSVAKNLGYPVILKATAGGGGKGIRVVLEEKQMEEAFLIIKNEASKAFKNDSIYMEKFLQNPKHIEVQILGDKHGNVVHLFERDCSVQRNNQKVIEEATSTIPEKDSEYIRDLTAQAMKKMGYYSAGTVEYLYENGKFYFMEMNTRLQVEHPVTEQITGLDLVEMMIRVANNEVLPIKQKDVVKNGYAIECRINAEDPVTFAPRPGTITQYHQPAGRGVRVDAAIYNGYKIPPFYDSMIGKVIVHGKDRENAIKILDTALSEMVIDGISTTIPLVKEIINQKEFKNGSFDIKWLTKWMEEKKKSEK